MDLTSPVLGNGANSYLSQGRLPYLSPRISENKPSLNAGLQMMGGNLGSTLKTARESTQADLIGRVQKNNFISSRDRIGTAVSSGTNNGSGASTLMTSNGIRTGTAATNGNMSFGARGGISNLNFQIGSSTNNRG